MPIEFDPAWEYWQPTDSDIVGILADSATLSGFDGLVDYRQDEQRQRAISGFRFGKVSARGFDFCRFTTGIAKPTEARGIHYHIKCRKCKGYFLPDRRGLRYCSMACRPMPGAVRLRPLKAICIQCQAEFVPMYKGQTYCCRRCGGLQGGPRKPEASLLAQFAKLYLAGMPMGEITTIVGVKRAQLQRWRRHLNLPPRPQGNHRNSKLRSSPGARTLGRIETFDGTYPNPPERTLRLVSPPIPGTGDPT